MLSYLHLLSARYESLSFLRLFQYVTFRAGAAAFTAFFVTLLLAPRFIRQLNAMQATAPDRLGEYDPDRAVLKNGKVPSMGGLLILAGMLAAIFLWCDPKNALVEVFVFLMIGLAIVGFIDDLGKIRSQTSKAGLSERTKLLLQLGIALVAVWWLDAVPATSGNVRNLMVPFVKHPVIVGMPVVLALAFAATVVVASSNAVNLTDGMDGLATGCVLITSATYAVFAYVCGHRLFADYLRVPFIPGSSEVVVIATAMIGALLGFLWHNCHPATMYMGDTGSLSLGGGVGLLAVLVKQELLLILVGGILVAEVGSVILQRCYFKYTRRRYGEGRRIFLCAPLHHHFEKLGWSETQIVVRFWIVALLLAGLGLATLKVR